MLTLFNRTKLSSTTSMQKQAEIRNILADNPIDYSIKTIDRNHSGFSPLNSRAPMGTLGMKMEYNLTYIIYVHKKDFVIANSLLRQKL